MKKFVLLLMLSMSFLYANGQLGYKVGSASYELCSDGSSFYYVQTKDADQMKRMLDTREKQSDNVKVIANLKDNACIVNSRLFGEGHYISEIYNNHEGNKIIILPRIAIKLKEGNAIEEVLAKFSQTITLDVKKANLYLVDCVVDNSEAVLTINNVINMQEGVEWCEPMMIGEASKANALEGLQYYLHNVDQYGNPAGVDINALPAWDHMAVDTTIVVAVLDDGVDRTHEDLVGSIVDGYTLYFPNEKGDPINEFENYHYVDTLNHIDLYMSDAKYHGTACAGIIGARNNNIGIRGVASGVRILPINIHPQLIPIEDIPYPTFFYEDVGDAITWAYNTANADIINCAMCFDNNAYISNALNNAMSYGRNGKGTVVVCASGNKKPYFGVQFPANMSNTIAVGAVDKTGGACSYSCAGNSLDIVALGNNIITTDRTAPKGANSTDNYVYFAGTSAACSQVTGVAALMLSANPDLPAWNVRYLLQNTARKLPGMNGQNRTDEYGYGLVDAYNAVRTIRPNIEGANILYTSETYYVDYLLDGSTVSWSLTGNNASNFILQEETPSSNQCTINRKFGELFGDTTDLVLSAQIMHNGIVINTITKSLVTPYISGPSDPCGSTVYSIAKLPAGLSVDWSINPAVSIFFNSILTTNSPQPNQCTITNNGDRAWRTNLYAAIKNSVGDTIATLVKPVRSTFDLLFSQEGFYGYPTIPLSPVESNETIIVNHKCWVDLSSPYFDGMTIWHTGASPRNFDTFNGHISFRFSTVTSNQSMTIHGTDGCKVMNLHVQVTPNGNIPIPMLEANPISGGYEILLTYENDEEATRSLTDKEWTLNVVNASSSEKEISWQVKGQRTTISTANWKQGVYVLQGIVDGQECTKKIVVK